MTASLIHLAITACALFAESEPGKPSAVRKAWWLWVGLFLLGVVLVLIVAAIGKRRRRAIEASIRPDRPRAIKDAWAEAGKRAEPLPEEDIDDEDER